MPPVAATIAPSHVTVAPFAPSFAADRTVLAPGKSWQRAACARRGLRATCSRQRKERIMADEIINNVSMSRYELPIADDVVAVVYYTLEETGRAHVCTPVTTAQLICR